MKDDEHDGRVLVVPEEVDVGVLGAHMFEGGPLPMGAHYESFEEFSARGRVADCDCQLIECVCAQARQHTKACRFRKALTCAIGIACEAHGFDVCPRCDPCECTAETVRAERAAEALDALGEKKER